MSGSENVKMQFTKP